MGLKEQLEKLHASDIFKTWEEKNKGFFLAHAFVMVQQDKWQIGYYSNEKETMTTFTMDDNIKVEEDQKVFKTEEEIKELNPDEVKISPKEALDKAEECRKENYKEIELKSFFILQNSSLGIIYNVTFLTGSFRALNIKVNASNSEVLTHKIYSIVEKV